MIKSEFEKQTKQKSKIFGCVSGISGDFQRVLEAAFGPPFEFVADRPVISPDQVLRPLQGGIHEHHGPLEIIEQDTVGLLWYFPQQSLKEPFGLVRIAPSLEKNERFAQFHVAGAVYIELPDHHQAAKNQ